MRPFPTQAAVPHCAALLQRLCKMHQPSTIYRCVCPSNMVPYGPLGECRVSATVQEFVPPNCGRAHL